MEQNPFNINKPISESTTSENKSNLEKLDIKIELATPDDWEDCKDLRLLAITSADAQMFSANPKLVEREQAKTEEDWKKDLSDKDIFYMLSKYDSDAVGMIRAWKKENGVWHLGQAYIKEDFRGKNIGKELYKAPLDEIIKRGGKKVSVFIFDDNKRSIYLAESLGFKKINLMTADYDASLKLRAWKNKFSPFELDLIKKST